MSETLTPWMRLMRLAREPWTKIQLARTAPRAGWYRLDDAFEFRVNPAELTDQAIVLGHHAADVLYLLDRWVQPGDVCIDVGGHKGYVSLHLALRVGPAGAVFAFEPDPSVRAELLANVERNACRQVTVMPIALGARDETLRFYVSTQGGWSTIYPNAIAQEFVREVIDVDVRSLDDLRQAEKISIDPRRLSFIKIDCEGAEPYVLSGMQRLLQEANPMIVLEVNQGSLQSAGSSLQGLHDVLHAAGFLLFLPIHRRLRHPSIVLKRIAEFHPSADSYDVVAIRQDRLELLERRGIELRP